MTKLRKWSVCGAVSVRAYGTLTVMARSAKEAERLALKPSKDGYTVEDKPSFWDSKLWQDCDWEPEWEGAEQETILDVQEVTND